MFSVRACVLTCYFIGHLECLCHFDCVRFSDIVGSASAGIATPGGGGEEGVVVDSRAEAALQLRERAEEVAAVKDWRALQHLG
jgi:hypothetical protein